MKLQAGDRVKVYREPLAKAGYEGQVKLLKPAPFPSRALNGREVECWEVHFLGDDEIHERWVCAQDVLRPYWRTRTQVK
jgi:hypothetical protein